MTSKKCGWHPRFMLDAMNELKDEEQFCDLTIVVGQKEIKAHKFVLIAASEYFRAMFSNDTKESKTGIVSFPDTYAEIVKQCINFIYSGKVEFSLNYMTDFIVASDIFCLHNLTRLYVEFLSENVSIENVNEMLSVVRLYQKKRLVTSIQIFLRDNLELFIESEKLRALPMDTFLHLLSLVQNWGKKYEMLKWHAVIAWVKDELDERKDAFVDLFDTIDMSLLPRQFIKDHVVSEPMVSESGKLMVKVCNKFLSDKPYKTPIVPKEKSTGIISCNGNTGSVYRYSLIEEEWSSFTRLPTGIATECLDAAEYKGVIYVTTGNAIFGFNGTEWEQLYENNSREQYNRCLGCWKYVSMVTGKCVVMYEIGVGRLSSIDIRRSTKTYWYDFAVTSTRECIYVIGGEFSQLSRKTAFQVDLRTRQCSRISNLPISVGHGLGCVFAFNGIVYAFSRGSDVVFYNDVTKKWQYLQGLAIKYIDGCKVHVADKLYLYGGKLGTNVQFVKLAKLIPS